MNICGYGLMGGLSLVQKEPRVQASHQRTKHVAVNQNKPCHFPVLSVVFVSYSGKFGFLL